MADRRFDRAAGKSSRPPGETDISAPSPARMYDYFLGGKDNFATDRKAAERVLEANPWARPLAVNNRRFLLRAVRFLAEQGVDQFIDLGTGIPTEPSVHAVAREIIADASVAYVDNDPVVTTHTRALHAVYPGVNAIEGDARDIAAITDTLAAHRMIDFTRPVAVLAAALLHFLDEETADSIVGHLRQVTPAASWLVISTATTQGTSSENARETDERYRSSTAGRFVQRSPERIAALFDGWTLVDPGIVDVAHWRGDDTPTPITGLAGVARHD